MKLPPLSTKNLLIGIVFIAIFTMAVRIPADTDTWWHLRSGQYIVENLTIPTTDPFSHTQAGHLWVDHGWLAQLFWYGLYAGGDWALVALALAAIVTLSFWFVWRQIEPEVNVFVAACAMILGAIVASVVWVARPQMITFLLTSVTAWLLYRFKRHDKSLLPWLPLLMVLWANIHGGFAIAFMLMVAYLLGEAVNNLTRHSEDPVVSWARLRHLLLAMALSLAVVVINPHTWRMWLYPFQTVGIGALRDFIQEWQSPNFHLNFVQPFVVMLLLTLGALARANRRADWTDLALIAMWAWWALFAARNIAIFGLVITPVLARYANAAWNLQWDTWGRRPPFVLRGGRVSRQQSLLNWGLLALVAVAALGKIVMPLAPAANLEAEQKTLPAAALAFVEAEQPPGPMFNSYNWGGYLIFKLWPDYPVYIDGRTDLYDDAFIRRYLGIMQADDGWAEKLDDDGINLIFIEHNSVLDKFLRQSTTWRELYRDKMAVIYGRRGVVE
jgi:hypothetical protein